MTDEAGHDRGLIAEPTARAAATSRRTLLIGVGTAAAVVLSGCATYGDTGGGTGSPASAGPDDAGSGPEETADDQPDGQALAQTTDIPVGGGVINDHKNIVITQPTAGKFKAFTAVCTHQGCIVAEVKNGHIICPCHGSQFKVADGKVAQGPANRALREVAITVTGTSILPA